MLTKREKEIITMAGQGLSNKEIAKALSIAPATVSKHLHHIYVKLNIRGRIKSFIFIGSNKAAE